uniref:Uncharacterized protein n=1 Tax=Oryza sativa subsp. japonica TaxID=39947 RepID=Q6YSU0_ORYSJ|nr:hypothetical protein [Oryza sativa Japonica Group]
MASATPRPTEPSAPGHTHPPPILPVPDPAWQRASASFCVLVVVALVGPGAAVAATEDAEADAVWNRLAVGPVDAAACRPRAARGLPPRDLAALGPGALSAADPLLPSLAETEAAR